MNTNLPVNQNVESLLAQVKALGASEDLLNEFRQAMRAQVRSRGWLSNMALLTDSYKASHYVQYPKDAEAMTWYVEARGGEFAKTVFFGLDMIIQEYLNMPLTKDDIDEAEAFWRAHGEPFDREGFEYILENYGGYLPVKIFALKEGTVLPVSMPMIRIESMGKRMFFMGGWIESLILQVWYPVTVATLSWSCKAVLAKYLALTADAEAMAGLPFKLHDFGFRGASSVESAARGGCAHLVNFQGSDTVPGVLAARRFYGCEMAGFSIPAAEHSTITSWGREFEREAYENMVEQFSRPGSVFAVVSDSYDLDNAVENIWGGVLKAKVIAKQGLLVVRPDSGDPETIVLRTLANLDKTYGSTVNTKGYRVLNHVRLIQGDGVNRQSIALILKAIEAAGFSTENVAFGMGGGLLQEVNRDTCKFAMKASAILRNGQWFDVFKDPITDQGKRSKKGVVTTYVNAAGEYCSGLVGQAPDGFSDALELVWAAGETFRTQIFEDIRQRANAALDQALLSETQCIE